MIDAKLAHNITDDAKGWIRLTWFCMWGAAY